MKDEKIYNSFGKAKAVDFNYTPTPNDIFDMTCLIETHNDTFYCMAADTLSTTTHGPETIHKIIYNKENKIAIGISGQTKTVYSLKEEYKYLFPQMLDIGENLQMLCDSYNGYNLQNIVYMITSVCEKVLRDEETNDNNNIGLIFLAYDKVQDKPVVFALHFVKVTDHSMQNNKASKVSYFSNAHSNLPSTFSYGTYSMHYNFQHGIESFENCQKSEILKWTIERVQEQIDKDLKKVERARRVGGKVEWITIDKDGNMETNIED